MLLQKKGTTLSTDGEFDQERQQARDVAASVARRAARVGARVAVAESLTGGQLCSLLAEAPDASTWFRGGVVAYASEVKHDLLDVPPGPVVSAEAARAMAEGVRHTLGADYAAAVTGVGGPDPQDDREPGTVFLAVAGPDGTEVAELYLPGDPGQVCRAAVWQTVSALDVRLADIDRAAG